jgi:hypothetical protein
MKTIVIEIPVKIYSTTDGAIAQGINPFSGIINIIILIIVIVGGWKGYQIYKSRK